MSYYSQFEFQNVLRKASEGKWALPEFQRDFKWKISQTVLLFDSLRSGFPLGNFLLANPSSFGQSKPFQFAKTSEASDLEYFVLDGQQRITAGIQLFYPNEETQKTFYFLSLENLNATLQGWLENTGKKIDDDDAIREFGDKILEADDGYLVGRSNVKDTWELFIKKKLIFTPFLIGENENRWDMERERYLKKYPDDSRLIQIVTSLFRSGKSYNHSIGGIIVDQDDPRTLSRIFTTLNNTGTPLTDFEITISEMWGQGVKLLDDIEKIREKTANFDNLDPSKTTILQVSLLLAGLDHRKINLPKTLNKEIWETFKDEAAESLEGIGILLLEHAGCPIDQTKNYIPYEPMIAPLAYAYAKLKPETMSSEDRKFMNEVFAKYFFTVSLTLHYSSGTNNKQLQDAKNLVKAVQEKDECLLFDTFDGQFGGLNGTSPSGALGKAVLCLLNHQDSKDPISKERIQLGSQKVQLHHIYPRKFLDGLEGVTKKERDSVANIMLLNFETNRQFTSLPPHNQIDQCKNQNKAFLDSYERQLFSEKCIEIMERPNPKANDFHEFLEERERCIEDAFDKHFSVAVMRKSKDVEGELTDTEELSD